jgi:hypothetical protein
MALIEFEDCRGEVVSFEQNDDDLTHLDPVAECARYLADRAAGAAETDIDIDIESDSH